MSIVEGDWIPANRSTAYNLKHGLDSEVMAVLDVWGLGGMGDAMLPSYVTARNWSLGKLGSKPVIGP